MALMLCHLSLDSVGAVMLAYCHLHKTHVKMEHLFCSCAVMLSMNPYRSFAGITFGHQPYATCILFRNNTQD